MSEPKYDGQDDSVLPEQIQKILEFLPEISAQRLRDWLTNYEIATIEEQLDYVLGAGKIFQPPVSTPSEEPLEELPRDPWEDAEHAVRRIAGMFRVLSDAGMSEQTAIAIIADEVREIHCAGKTISGLAEIPIAGARAILGHSGDGSINLSGGPVAGWPPKPI